MKKIGTVLLLSFTTTVLFAQTDSTNNTSEITALAGTADTANQAKIYLIRSTGHIGSAVNLRIFVDDVAFCKVRNNRYALFWVEPGTHLFNATTWDKPKRDVKFALKVPVEAGKTYYMSAKIKPRFAGVEITLEEITYNTAAPMLEKYKQDECD